MNTQRINLDLAKSTGHQQVTIAQGDAAGTTIVATIYDNGTKLAETGVTAKFLIELPDHKHYVRDNASYADGVVTYVCDESRVAAVHGYTDNAYFELRKGNAIVSTERFAVVVEPCAYDGMEPGETYDNEIEEAIEALAEATEAIPDTVRTVTEEILEDHPEWTTTVTDGSVTDAKLVQTGGILSRVDRLMYRLDNLLTADTGEQEVAVVADAAATPVAGLTVYGRSTQDGTPAPDAPVAIQSVEGNLYSWAGAPNRTNNGITWTVNADGSIHASGTATATSYGVTKDGVTLGSQNRPLLPAGTYTASSPDGATFDVEAMPVGGENASISGYGTEPATFTLTEASYVFIGVRVANGAVVDADYHVALHRGSVALPFVPYGHAGLWAQGTNLARNANQSRTVNGVTFTINADSTITADGTATANAQFNLVARTGANAYLLPNGAYALTGCPAGGSESTYELTLIDYAGTRRMRDYGSGATYTFADGTGMNGCGLYIMIRSGQTVSGLTFRPMLVRGSTTQPYQPYVESVTPVPLGGHVLRSLPDGTRDEVTVDARGHATLVQRVGEVTLDGTETWYFSSSQGRSFGYTALPNVANNSPTLNLVCDRFMVTNTLNAGTVYQSGTNALFWTGGAYSPTNSAEAKAWAASNPITVLYKLATPVTHDLGTVDPVALTSPDATLQAVTGIGTTFRADYERDLNVTLARLEAAIATLA